MMKLKISVSICTWNRAKLLDNALNKMGNLNIPKDVDWELLIINNNSTDCTDEVVVKHSTNLPIKYLLEPQPGKSFALNKAIENAEGDYMLWTDDDALVDSDWINAYCEAFRARKDIAIFGGPVQAKFEGNPPKWINVVEEKIPFVYSILECKDGATELTPDNLPYGINFAIRMSEQRKYHFDERLGPRPNSALRMEEWELMRKMLSDGAKGVWVPEALVTHHIPQNRISLAYVRDYCRGWGEYLAMLDNKYSGPTLFGKPRWRWRNAIQKEFKYRINRLFSKSDIWMDDLVTVNKEWGRLLGSRKNSIR
jgi:glycosyltransferase involved in cell wall biosynthesis